jgi:hypothetical protein
MSVLVWVMVGLALWHFSIYLPDHFWGGIVGALVGAIAGSIIGGLLLHGFAVPSRDAVDLQTFFEGIPGTVLGMGIVYFEGLRRERARDAADHAVTPSAFGGR